MCFALREERALFSGDHVMAWATSVIAPPDGDMAQYFASLGKLLERDDQVYHPGHGPSRPNPLPLVRGYLAHRRMREEAIRSSVDKGARSVADVVATVYAGLDSTLHGAASLSARAHLDHLVEQGRLRKSGGVYEPVPGNR
jgi:glyoxylase-like metal-dependent hydrolase (beta-lactamase superfamily II)